MSRAGGGAKEAPERGGEAWLKGRRGVGIWGEREIVEAVPRRRTLEND